MKTQNLLFATIAIGGIFFWLIAPAHVRDKVIGLATFASNERQCFNLYKKDFNDPDSAYVESSYIWTRKEELEFSKENANPAFKKYEAMLRVKIHAINRMGAYISDYVECPLINGQFNELAALTYQLRLQNDRN